MLWPCLCCKISDTKHVQHLVLHAKDFAFENYVMAALVKILRNVIIVSITLSSISLCLYWQTWNTGNVTPIASWRVNVLCSNVTSLQSNDVIGFEQMCQNFTNSQQQRQATAIVDVAEALAHDDDVLEHSKVTSRIERNYTLS